MKKLVSQAKDCGFSDLSVRKSTHIQIVTASLPLKIEKSDKLHQKDKLFLFHVVYNEV